jgi:glycosyltransferase involved in cell wall biosynthesis
MQNISAVIITYNEARNIERCILSLKDVADEILVLDSFSTDTTKAICEKLGVRFEERAWEGYSASKNHANSIAKNDWILSLDADEELSETLKNSILSEKKILNNSSVYAFNRKTNYCGKWINHCGWYPDKKIRLFHRKTTSWQGDIHETLLFPSSIAVMHLQGDLLHYSFSTKEEHEKKSETYAILAAQDLYKKGKRASFIKRKISPLIRFVRDYVIKLGFLDGKEGLEICTIAAKTNCLKYKKLHEMHKAK